jgi:hypothetical protein
MAIDVDSWAVDNSEGLFAANLSIVDAAVVAFDPERHTESGDPMESGVA